MNDNIFRYRIITNLECNMNPPCYFCYQPDKSRHVLSLPNLEHTMKKVTNARGKLKRATIMGGESTLLGNLEDYIKVTNKFITDDICLVTNGILLDKEKLSKYSKTGLTEVAISISSIEQYEERREQCLLSREYIPNTRINIPKSHESTGEKLDILLKRILTDGFYIVVCEDLMGRYGDYTFQDTLPAKLIGDDGHNFISYEWNGHPFGMFAHYKKYDDTDVIISPYGNFTKWEQYCEKVGNSCLK